MLLSNQLWITYNYLLVLFQEFVEFWRIYLLLILPAYMFPTYGCKITFLDKDDLPKTIWMTLVCLIHKYPDGRIENDTLCGAQLMFLANDYGQIPIKSLIRYYPNLYMVYIQYTDMNDLSSSGANPLKGTSSYHGLSLDVVSRLIDIDKRVDIRSGHKCKFGRIQI